MSAEAVLLPPDGRVPPAPDVDYPDSDGQPMADNTLQYEWITTIKGNLDLRFLEDPDVFVAGDLLWYAVEGDPTKRTAPDVMVVFGRPKGDRGSYQQWKEAGIAPQVVFEILSPGNRPEEMQRKQLYYELHGVEEYYLCDPDFGRAAGYVRTNGHFEEIPEIDGWVSPRLGIRFGYAADGLQLYHPSGSRFLSYAELGTAARQEQARAEQERARAEQERARAEQERARAEQQQARAERLAAQLRALGVEPDA